MTTMPITSGLSRGAKVRAARAIEEVHLAYYAKGGIRDLEDKLAEQRGAAARHIFSLAQYASEHTSDLDETMALFIAMCAYAEQKYKAMHDVLNLKEALPTWAVFKSNILRGIREYGLDPLEYRSEGAFRVAMLKMQERQSLPPPHRGPAALDAMLASAIPSTSVRSLLSQLIIETAAVRRSKQQEAEEILREAMSRLRPMLDRRKIA